MADNVELNSGTGGATLATDEIPVTLEHYQYVKLADGTANSTTKVSAGGGTEATALRVTIATDSTGVLSVDDNGAALTVDGTVTANAGTNLNTSALALEAGGNLATIAGAVSGTEMQVDIVSLPAVDTELTTADLDTGAGTDTRAVVGLVGSASGGGALIPGSATDGLLVNLGTNNDISGTVTANAGTNLNTSALALEAGGNLATIAGAVSGTEMQVDIISLPAVDTELTTADLDTGAGTDTRAVVGLVGSASGGGALIPGSATDGLLVNLGTNNDITGTVTANLAAGTNTNEVVGDVAHDAGVSGNPVLVCGAAQNMDDTAPPNRVSAESDATRIATDWDGTIFAHPHGPQIWSYHADGSSALTDASVHAAPAAGLSIYVTDIVCSSGAATAMNIFFEEGASKVLGPYYLEATAGRGLAIHFTTPKKITAATALTVTTSAAIAHAVDVTGFIAQG